MNVIKTILLGSYIRSKIIITILLCVIVLGTAVLLAVKSFGGYSPKEAKNSIVESYETEPDGVVASEIHSNADISYSSDIMYSGCKERRCGGRDLE